MVHYWTKNTKYYELRLIYETQEFWSFDQQCDPVFFENFLLKGELLTTFTQRKVSKALQLKIKFQRTFSGDRPSKRTSAERTYFKTSLMMKTSKILTFTYLRVVNPPGHTTEELVFKRIFSGGKPFKGHLQRETPSTVPLIHFYTF